MSQISPEDRMRLLNVLGDSKYVNVCPLLRRRSISFSSASSSRRSTASLIIFSASSIVLPWLATPSSGHVATNQSSSRSITAVSFGSFIVVKINAPYLSRPVPNHLHWQPARHSLARRRVRSRIVSESNRPGIVRIQWSVESTLESSDCYVKRPRFLSLKPRDFFRARCPLRKSPISKDPYRYREDHCLGKRPCHLPISKLPDVCSC